MTEKKWLAATHPEPMLKFLRKKASDRKLRLLIVGSAQLISDSMTAPQLRQAIEVAERFADGEATEAERAAAEGELGNGRSGRNTRQPTAVRAGRFALKLPQR